MAAAAAPSLLAVLKEMKDGLDTVTIKIQQLTHKVKQNQFPTADGVTYLEAKHLLLFNYCHTLVYYLLRKANGLSIDGHPLVRSLVETRLFLEKIRPIDKKLDYQLQRLTRAASGVEKSSVKAGEKDPTLEENGDHLQYRPNPDMLVPKVAPGGGKDNVYRPPKIAPTTMDEDKMSKEDKLALRREKELLRESKQSSFRKDILDDIEGKPEELREFGGSENRELSRYLEKREKQDRQEEKYFTRAPITKQDKKLEKQLMRSRGGLSSLTDQLFGDMGPLAVEEKSNDDDMTNTMNGTSGNIRHKKHKRKH